MTTKSRDWPPQDQWPYFLFFRYDPAGKVVFYPVALPNEDEVLPNVKCNPSTIKVTDADGKVIWSAA
jgi:hypothetical protein